MEIRLKLTGSFPQGFGEDGLNLEMSLVSLLEAIFYYKSNGWNNLAAFLV